MRFMTMYTAASKAPPSNETMAGIGKFSEEMAKSGVLVSTGGLLPNGARLKLSGGKFTDGPFAEAKEVVIGWAIIDVKSKEEAIEFSKRFMKIAGDGDCELRQVMGADFRP